VREKLMMNLIYISSATREMSEYELIELLNYSRTENLKKNVTGMLLYGGGNFFQVLEGEKNDVESIYEAILADPRNTDHVLINRCAIYTKDFPKWSMGFKHLTLKDKKNIKGYSNFLDNKMMPGELAGLNMTVDLLFQFKQDNP
jgi:hypothetical protein